MRGAGWKLVCLDLDDTLIREVHSVMLPCILNGKEQEHAVIQRREDGVFTGQISSYLTCEEKITCVKDYCEKSGISPEQCAAVGDGATDIPLFGYCGCSVAFNAKPEVKAQAACWVDTDDLMDVLEYLVPRQAEDGRGGQI